VSAVKLSIKAKRVVSRGVKCYQVTELSSYGEEELPIVYFEQYPYCIYSEDMLEIVTNDKHPVFEGGGCTLRVGEVVPEYYFDKILEVVRVCGNKLHNINELIRLNTQEWKGEEEFTI
jgi:hypothetical protein